MYMIVFFKQKTAYDLRISDWSSDVCSSDLDGQVDETLAMAKSPREIFVGRWYGETPVAGGVTKRWVVDAFPDGVFRITFRFYDKDGSYREQVEVGEWGISGPVYFLSTKGWVDDGLFLKADTRNGELYDAYKILKLDAGVFEYEHYVNGSQIGRAHV